VLTPAGAAGHADVAQQVRGVRGAMSEGLTEQEYLAAVEVLRRMARNLERAA
jgi:hypothetical protein